MPTGAVASLTRLHAAGHFYKGQYKGFYSTKEETFLTEKDRLPDGTFDPSYGEVVEFKQNRHKSFFHIKRGSSNQNFRPRSGEELETLLILALYKKFSR